MQKTTTQILDSSFDNMTRNMDNYFFLLIYKESMI